jgi:hypothetical protein
VILMMDGHNSFIHANPCSVFSTLHAICAIMWIRMCSECYVRYVCKCVCTYDLHSHCLLECGRNLVAALRSVMDIRRYMLSKYIHNLLGLVIEIASEFERLS